MTDKVAINRYLAGMAARGFVPQLYAHFQDLVDAYVGPFTDPAQVEAHRVFCEQRGDGAVFLGIVATLPADAFVLTPQEDRDFTM